MERIGSLIFFLKRLEDMVDLIRLHDADKRYRHGTDDELILKVLADKLEELKS